MTGKCMQSLASINGCAPQPYVTSHQACNCQILCLISPWEQNAPDAPQRFILLATVNLVGKF